VGFVNDEHNLTPTFVFCEQGAVEGMCQLYRVIGDLLEAKFPADHL